MGEVLYRRSAFAAVDAYDRFRRRRGYEPIGDAILTAIEQRLVGEATWEQIPVPTFRVRGEVFPVKRLLIRVRSKTFKEAPWLPGQGARGGLAPVPGPGPCPLPGSADATPAGGSGGRRPPALSLSGRRSQGRRGTRAVRGGR